MDEFTLQTFNAVSKYFDLLKATGYCDNISTQKLVITLFINRMLNELFVGYMDEKDYTSLMDAYSKMMGSTCLLSFPDYATYDSMVHESKDNSLLRMKVTEDGIPRAGELGGFQFHEEETTFRQPPHIPPYDVFSEALERIE